MQNQNNQQPDQQRHSRIIHTDQGIFNLPPGLSPVDTVIDVDQIPGTDNLNLGEVSRVVETVQGERLEFIQRRGARLGCGHLVYHRSEIGGSCGICGLELVPYLQQGLISQKEAEERILFCREDKGFCLACHTQALCAKHTVLYQPEPGISFLPLCPLCHEKIKKGVFKRLFSFFVGVVRAIFRFLLGLIRAILIILIGIIRIIFRNLIGIIRVIIILFLVFVGVDCANL